MKRPRTISAGFSLVEVAVATGIVSFCLIPLLGLLFVGLSSTNTSSKETQLANLTAQIVSDLRTIQTATSPLAVAKSPFYNFTLPANTGISNMSASQGNPQTVYVREDGSATGAVGSAPTSNSRYRITLGMAMPVANARTAPLARILITWPAQADPNPAQWPSKYSGCYETVVGLGSNQ